MWEIGLWNKFVEIATLRRLQCTKYADFKLSLRKVSPSYPMNREIFCYSEYGSYESDELVQII